ncbi:MAG: mechanosensitive ion channel domain-containing protein, partial [Alphaproteobacteria bacterium]
CLLLCGLVLFGGVCRAETTEKVSPVDVVALQLLVDTNEDYAKINPKLNKIEQDLKASKITIKQTAEYIKVLSNLQDYVLGLKAAAESELDATQKRLDALGNVPENGVKEAPDIARKRSEFNKQITALKSNIAESDLVIAKIDDLSSMILNLRNETLLNSLSTREDSIFNPKTFYVSTVGFFTFMYDILKSPWSWYDSLTDEQRQDVNSHALGAVITMALALILGLMIAVFIRHHFGYRGKIENPTYTQKVSAAVWIFVARGLLPAGVLGAFIYWVNSYDLINGTPFGTFLKVGASYLLAIFLLQAGVKSIFTPKRGMKWRLIDVTDENAKSLSHTLLFSIVSICIVSFFQSMVIHTDTTQEMDYSVKVIANLVKAVCIVLVAQRFLYKQAQTGNDTANTADADEDEQLSFGTKIGSLITLTMSAAFVLSLFGYIKLSSFILNRFIAMVIFLGVLFIIYRLTKVILHQILSIRYWTKSLNLTRKMVDKLEFWIGFFLTPVFILFAVFCLLGLWGVSVDILIQNAKKFLTGFNIGGIRISLVSIFMGIISFVVSLFVFKMIKNSLQSGALSKIDMDPGVRNSLTAGIGFLGTVLSAIFALAVMGGSFGSIALIAGALSFGAGLGLQNVVNNFVSGIILLFERPIKIGDWVIINGQEGIVKRINIRSTSLETWTKSDVIIPNADILSSSLINMTYDNRMGRVDIVVGVGYGSDIELVKKTLVSIPLENKKVLKNPQPFVLFTNMGDSSLDFQLSCFTSDILSRAGIATDLRERIIKRFREEGIEIPFPQRDVHIIPMGEAATASVEVAQSARTE